MTANRNGALALSAFVAMVMSGPARVRGQESKSAGDLGSPGGAVCQACDDSLAATCDSTTSCSSGAGCCDLCGVVPCRCGYCGWRLGGWVEMGVTTGNRNPRNPAAGLGNLPVAFNYRKDECQLNQVWAYLEKDADTGGCGWALGGRADVMCGEDYIFMQAAGLETTDEFVNHWNTAAGGDGIFGAGRSGLALPQFYADLAYNDWTLRVGHFCSITGYEAVAAPDNFFYSHAYALPYGEPITLTGGLLTWDPRCGLSLTSGIVNGWDQFDGSVDRSSLLFSAGGATCDGRSSLTFSLITGDEDGAHPPIAGNRTMYSVVLTHKLNPCWQYVLQHDLGWQDNDRKFYRGVRDAIWYGASQYLFYTINPCWQAGLRYEWFDDKNGARVSPYGAYWYELTAGLNWTPNSRWIVRPELRWDWADFHNRAAPPGPFGNQADRSQFLAAVDVIVRF